MGKGASQTEIPRQSVRKRAKEIMDPSTTKALTYSATRSDIRPMREASDSCILRNRPVNTMIQP